MPAPAKPTTTIFDFPGLTDEPRSSVNLPPGAASEQVNACSITEGTLQVRRGVKQVTFEDA